VTLLQALPWLPPQLRTAAAQAANQAASAAIMMEPGSAVMADSYYPIVNNHLNVVWLNSAINITFWIGCTAREFKLEDSVTEIHVRKHATILAWSSGLGARFACLLASALPAHTLTHRCPLCAALAQQHSLSIRKGIGL
jgi:hypothetical protein